MTTEVQYMRHDKALIVSAIAALSNYGMEQAIAPTVVQEAATSKRLDKWNLSTAVEHFTAGLIESEHVETFYEEAERFFDKFRTMTDEDFRVQEYSVNRIWMNGRAYRFRYALEIEMIAENENLLRHDSHIMKLVRYLDLSSKECIGKLVDDPAIKLLTHFLHYKVFDYESVPVYKAQYDSWIAACREAEARQAEIFV